jgi:hypothetical protein
VDFTVEIGGLKALGGNLRHCADNLEGALDALNTIGGDSLGRSSLDDACNDFQDSWRHGLDKIRECSQKLVDGVDASRKDYAEVDGVLRKGFGGMAEDIGNPQAGGGA